MLQIYCVMRKKKSFNPYIGGSLCDYTIYICTENKNVDI